MSHDFRYTQDDILRGKAVSLIARVQSELHRPDVTFEELLARDNSWSEHPEILEQVRRWHSERFAWEAQG
jgi:hypothetical protein